jgi:hypothetical protein
MLGKSAKMVPVMVWSHYVGGKSFSLRSWVRFKFNFYTIFTRSTIDLTHLK